MEFSIQILVVLSKSQVLATGRELFIGDRSEKSYFKPRFSKIAKESLLNSFGIENSGIQFVHIGWRISE